MKSILWVIPFVLLSGCAITTPSLPVKQQNSVANRKPVSHLADVEYRTLAVNHKRQDSIDDHTQQFSLPSGTTPVIGYQLPLGGNYKISVHSLVKRKMTSGSVFAPKIVLLDEAFNTIRTLPAADMHYQPLYFLTPESLSIQFQIIHNQARYMLVYTTNELRGKTTRLFNEAKAYAQNRGQTPLPIADIEAKHDNIGTLQIELTPIDPGAADARIRGATTALQRLFSEPARTPVTTNPEIERRIKAIGQNIKSELDKGNISQALLQRREAKAIAQYTEQTFINAYGKAPDKLKVPALPGDQSSQVEQTRYFFVAGVIEALKAGETNKALQLVDKARELATEADKPF